jgi:hypothetical protein
MGVEVMVMELEATIVLGTPNLLKLPSSSQGFRRKVETRNGAWMLSWLLKQEQEVSALLSPALQFQAPIHPSSCCLDIQLLLSLLHKMNGFIVWFAAEAAQTKE